MTPDEVIRLVHQIDDAEAEIRDLRESVARLRNELAMATGAAAKGAAISNPRDTATRTRTSPLKNLAIRHIQENPKADYRSLVLALYKNDTDEAIKNARTIIFRMKTAGAVEGSPGAWRVRTPSVTAPEEDDQP